MGIFSTETNYIKRRKERNKNMCLIVTSPKGKSLPKRADLKRWFKDNPDGFGLAYNTGTEVRILKGGMDFSGMFKIIRKLNRQLRGLGLTKEDVDIVLHFRFSTGGHIQPCNCHPFPLTTDEALLAGTNVQTEMAIAHNGIITEYSTFYRSGAYYSYTWENKTDTQQFIEEYLANMGRAILNPAVRDLIEDYTVSKFAILTESKIFYIGNFIEDNGFLYSNSGYKTAPPVDTKVVVKEIKEIVDQYEEDTDPSGEDETRFLPVKTDGGTNFYRDKDGVYKSYPKLKNRHCDFCDQETSFLYYMEEEDSDVCAMCYYTLMGAYPTGDLLVAGRR